MPGYQPADEGFSFCKLLYLALQVCGWVRPRVPFSNVMLEWYEDGYSLLKFSVLKIRLCTSDSEKERPWYKYILVILAKKRQWTDVSPLLPLWSRHRVHLWWSDQTNSQVKISTEGGESFGVRFWNWVMLNFPPGSISSLSSAKKVRFFDNQAPSQIQICYNYKSSGVSPSWHPLAKGRNRQQ